MKSLILLTYIILNVVIFCAADESHKSTIALHTTFTSTSKNSPTTTSSTKITISGISFNSEVSLDFKNLSPISTKQLNCTSIMQSFIASCQNFQNQLTCNVDNLIKSILDYLVEAV